MRLLLGALVLVSGMIAGSFAPQRATAAQPEPPAAVKITQEEAGLPDADLGLIERRIQLMLAFHQGKTWKCMKLPVEGQRRPNVRVTAHIIKQSGLFSTTYVIQTTVTAPGLGTLGDSEEWTPEDDQLAPHLTFISNLGERVAGSIGSILGAQSPCKATASFKARLIQGGGGAEVVATYSADAELDLGEDGAFEQTLPLTASISFPVPGCTSDYRYVNPQLRLAGRFAGDGEQLALESVRLTWDGMLGNLDCGASSCRYNSRGTSACTSSAGTVTMPPFDDFSGIDPAAGSVALAFADGAASPLNRPAGLPGDVSWQSSLELRLPDAAPALAVRTARD